MERPGVPESQHARSFPTLTWKVTSAYRPTGGTALLHLSISSFFHHVQVTRKLVLLGDPLHDFELPFGCTLCPFIVTCTPGKMDLRVAISDDPPSGATP